MWNTHGKTAPEDVASASEMIPVPEPSRSLLLGAGLGCLVVLHRLR